MMKGIRVSEASLTESQNDSNEEKEIKSAFTARSIIFGVLGLLFTLSYAAINDFMFKQTPFIANHLPPGPIFMVVCIALVWNPMWSKRALLGGFSGFFCIFWGIYFTCVLDHYFFFSWHILFLIGVLIAVKEAWFQRCSELMQLSGRELMVTLLIILAGAWTAGPSLNNHFGTTLVNMWSVYSNNLQMQNVNTIEYIPQHLWPAGGLSHIGDNAEEKARVYDAFTTGSKLQGHEGVPWDAWIGPILSGWGPLFVLFTICVVAMSFVVHRQWSRNEQLAYPIAHIGGAVFQKEKGQALPSIFYNKLFLLAMGLVLCFHGIRYLHAWWPTNFPDISTTSWLPFVREIFPVLRKSGSFYIDYFAFYFCIIGISYFLSREVGLSLGIAPFLLALFSAQTYMISGSPISGSDAGNMRAGAYLVYAIIILYTGRYYYLPLLKKALFLNPKTDVEEDAVLAARLFVVAFFAMVLVLRISFNLDLDLSFLFALIAVLMFLVFTRIICETGIPYLQPAWNPAVVLLKTFGVTSAGAAPIVLLYYINVVLMCDPKESLMPYVANGLKMGEDHNIKLKRMFKMFLVVAVLAIFVSIGIRLYHQYTLGGHAISYPWGDIRVPTQVLKNSTRDLVALESMGGLTAPDSGERVGFIDRIANFDPDMDVWKFMIVGGLGILFFSIMRFKFIWFPLHPAIFLIAGIDPLARTFYSFLIGWGIRELIVRFGGGVVYQQLKPFFIGLIIGELSVMGIAIFISFLCYLFTGDPGPSFYFNFG